MTALRLSSCFSRFCFAFGLLFSAAAHAESPFRSEATSSKAEELKTYFLTLLPAETAVQKAYLLSMAEDSERGDSLVLCLIGTNPRSGARERLSSAYFKKFSDQESIVIATLTPDIADSELQAFSPFYRQQLNLSKPGEHRVNENTHSTGAIIAGVLGIGFVIWLLARMAPI